MGIKARPRRFSVDDIMALGPCGNWPRDRAEQAFGSRKRVTAAQIAAADIHGQDRLWVLIGLMDARTQRLFACDCAERVVHLANDPRSTAAIQTARLFAFGLSTTEELDAARDAAWASAGDVARAAARAAAWDAAGASAGAAAGAAARAAAWDAAWDAAWASARASAGASARASARASAGASARASAERDWQLARAVEWIDRGWSLMMEARDRP